MIIRVTIHCEAINLHSCEIYTDEEEALRSTDEILDKYKLNDGCSLGSEDDFPALNAMIAEKFDDLMNLENHAEWEDITESVIYRIADNICYLKTDRILSLANELGIDLEDV